jgi:hypothetical protein
VCIFFIFWPSKIHISSTSTVSSLFPPRCHLSFGRCHHAITLFHASFPLSQDELVASTSSSNNAFSYRLSSRAKTEALNPHHRRRLPSSDHPTLTLHCYKKIISTLTTLLATQPRLHFASSLARAARYQSSTSRHRSLSPLSHAHRPSAQ